MIAALLMASATAHATPTLTVSALTSDGERLQHEGRYADAIDTFKAADRISPHTLNPCAIARAYASRELWAQAELALHACHDRASASDPAPAWTPEVDAAVANALINANLAPVEIRVSPDIPVALGVASFGQDEPLSQRTIHLPTGHDVIVASADGYETAHVDVQIVDNKPTQVLIELHRVGLKTPSYLGSIARAKPSVVPWMVAGTGGALVLGGVALDLFYAQPMRNKPDAYNAARNTSYGLYGVGAAAAIVGIVLHYTAFKGPAGTEMHLGADTVHAGAVVQLGFSR